MGGLRGQRQEVRADALVEGVTLGLQAVMHLAAAATPLLRRNVNDDGQVGDDTIDGPPLQLRDLVGPKVTPGPLVGDGGVGVAVRDDDAPGLQGGADDEVDVLSLVGGEEQRLGARRHMVTMQHKVADLGAKGCTTGLASHQHLAPQARQPVREQPDLGGFARAIAALEGHEHAGCIHAGQPSRAPRHLAPPLTYAPPLGARTRAGT